MARTKKKLLGVKDRILLYLSTVSHRYDGGYEAPITMTQIGIANHVGIARQNVPRDVNSLIEEGLVECKKKHISGLKIKRNIYYLSSMGFSRVADLNLKLSGISIRFIDKNGEDEKILVKDIPNRLSHDFNYNDIIRDTEYSVLNYADIIMNMMHTQQMFRSIFFTPKYLFGREAEIETIRNWSQLSECRTLVIKGIAGIGKTTLMAKIALEWSKKHKIFSYKIHEWATLKNILLAIGNYYGTLNDNELLNYLRVNEQLDLAELHILLEGLLLKHDVIIIIDDAHYAKSDVRQLFKMMFETILSTGNSRLVIISRATPSFYDRRHVNVLKTVKEIQLDGLDRTSSFKLLSELKYDVNNIDELYNTTKGHPLFLELSEGKSIGKSMDIQKFVLEVFISDLDENELELLNYISVFRYSVSEGAVSPKYKEFLSILPKGILRELSDGTYELHDVVKNHLYRRQGKKNLCKHHSLAAEYYVEEESIFGTLEAIHHRIEAKEFILAAELAIEHGRAFIKNGYSAELSRYIAAILVKFGEIRNEGKLELILLMAESLAIIGEWDEALEHHEHAIAIGTELEDKKAIAKAHLGMGEIYLLRDERDNATSHLEEALIIYKELGDDRGISETTYQQGVILERSGKYDNALKNFKRCENIAGNIEDKRILAKALNASGRIYNIRGKYKKAMKVKEKALEYLIELNEPRELAKVYIGLGVCAFNLLNIDDAIRYHTKAIEVAESVGDIRLLGHGLSNIASAYIEKPDLNMATENLDRAKEIFTKLDEKRMLSAVHLTYGAVWNAREKWDYAIENFEMSVKLFREINDLTSLARAKYKFGLLYKNMGEIEKARKLFEEAIKIYEDIDEHDLAIEISMMVGKTNECP